MKNATVTTFAQNDKPSIVVIDNVGTMSMIGFAQLLHKNNIIDYTTFNKSRKVAFTSEFATKLVNENPSLFPSF